MAFLFDSSGQGEKLKGSRLNNNEERIKGGSRPNQAARHCLTTIVSIREVGGR